MARRPTPDARERILETAGRLFDEHGVHAVGMQQIIDEVGVGKQLLYREFPSKDALIVAYLRYRTRDWRGVVDGARERTDDPAEQLLEIVRSVQHTTPGTRGCPLRNTHAEFPDPAHPAHQVSMDHFREAREQLRELARATGAPRPDRLGDRIMLILDGLYVSGSIFGTSMTDDAVDFARDVIVAETAGAPAR
ncbi:TetR/AcrR family transcriptional regulator [Jiangella endophytica]|uniref:TetR/AcrR family transcriptional regulator n=1 Tax=Jiangella endophytica TaxID=1623398 RepID=UPI00130069F7|nr:TetR/AcrR family transcriptional regulator [Jiangella endophytica]